MMQKLHSKRGGFTLVEIMIVVAIIALLAAIAVPNFLRSRKRSQATRILEDLRLIDAAIDQYAIENNMPGGHDAFWPDLQPYVKQGTALYSSRGPLGTLVDVLGNPFHNGDSMSFDGNGPFKVDQLPSVGAATFEALSDVAPASFWSPYITRGILH
jgi:prepilin-type N-terminal cleavage/methylation domain-containing protein